MAMTINEIEKRLRDTPKGELQIVITPEIENNVFIECYDRVRNDDSFIEELQKIQTQYWGRCNKNSRRT